MLSPDRMERLRKALIEERDQLQADMNGLDTEMLVNDTNAGVGNHPAEDASLMYEQEAFVSLRRNDRSQLEQVEHALERMERGTYGICQRCGREIDFARLKAKPEAALCMDCHKLAEL
jgi:DnaK suppressor protein